MSGLKTGAGVIAGTVAGLSMAVGVAAFIKETLDQRKSPAPAHEQGVYEKHVKRPLDAALSTGAALVLSPILLATAALVRIKLGSPVLFAQERPGKDGEIFTIFKFRTMTDETDPAGNLLSDESRLTPFGKMLRTSSIDELPELINIIKGDMAVVGPRPLLVEYLPRYNEHQARRHEVRPGLTGYAQSHGRNAITWEDKFDKDVYYVDNVGFCMDASIILQTVKAVFDRDGISSDTSVTMEDFMGSDAS